MSISNFQEKVIKGPLGKGIMLLSVAAMAVGLGFSSCSKSERLQALDAKGNPEKPFVTVAGVEIPIAWVDESMKAQMERMQGGEDMLKMLPPEYKVGMYGQAIQGLVQQAYGFEMATRSGIKVDDLSVKKQLGIDTVDAFKAKLREQLEKGSAIKKGASEKEMEDFVKSQTGGKTIADFYKEQIKQVDETLADKTKRPKALLGVAQTLFVEKLKKEINPTDEEVKKSLETYEVKRIVTNGDDRTKIDKAYTDLKGGKAFDEILEAVSEAPAPTGKKKSEDMMQLTQYMVDKQPDFQIIGKLQPGGYSEPVKTASGYAIYKYAGKKGNVPADYDKQKVQLKENFIMTEVQKRYTEGIEKLEKDILPKFELKSYEAMYLFAKAQMKPSPKDQQADFQKVVELARSVGKQDAGYELAVSAELAAFQRIFDAPGADKTKLKPERIAGLMKYVEIADESWVYRKEIITSYKEQKDGEKAYSQLAIALDKNLKYDAMGQSTYSDISAVFQELKTANILKPEQVTEFETKQKQWLNEKASFDKTQAEFKKQQEEEQKKQEAEQKKQEAAGKQNKSGSLIPKK